MQGYLDWIDKAVSARLEGGAIGKPVFVRMFLQLSADHGVLEPLLGSAIRPVVKWFGAPTSRVRIQGGVKAGYLSGHFEMAGGQSALIAVEAATGEPSCELLVIGQHGSLKFDDYPEPLSGVPAPVPGPEAAWIRKAIASGAVETVR
jgi:hypothetical protein